MNRYLQRSVAIAAMLVVLVSGTARAEQASTKLALSPLIQEALARNPEVQAMRQQLEAAAHRIPQARALPDPSIQVQLWNFPETFNVGQTQNAIFGVSQTFPFPGKLALRGEVAQRAAEITEQAVRTKEREVIARLKQAYYELFLAHKAIEIHHEQVELVKQLFETANARFRTGKGSQTDVLKAQVELSTLHQHLPVLEQRLETVQAKVNTILDRDPTFPLGVPLDPTPATLGQELEDLYQHAVKNRPELKAAELAIRRQEQSRALAQRQYYPDFVLGFQRFQNYQAPDGFGALATVSLPFAFWSKRKYDAAVREAVAAADAARADYHAWENITRFQIKDLMAKVRASERVADLYRTTILPQA
ncbi:MAG: hypothetical protein C4294_12310, partial [Nitrospiraceae bacterium]